MSGWEVAGDVGGGLNLLGVLALLLVVSPPRKRYRGMIVSADGDNPGLKRFLRDQSLVGAAIALGTALQLASTVALSRGS